MTTTRTARLSVATLAIAALVIGGAGIALAAPNRSPAIPLNTGQEEPAPSVGGAHGKFSYEINGDELCYTVEVTGLSSPAVAAHIHRAQRNVDDLPFGQLPAERGPWRRRARRRKAALAMAGWALHRIHCASTPLDSGRHEWSKRRDPERGRP